MTIMRNVLIAALAAGIVFCASAGPVYAAAEKSGSGTAKLTYDPMGAARARTPAWAANANRFSFGGSSSLRVAGALVKASTRLKGKIFYVGIDRDGNGSISSREWTTVPRTRTLLISGKAGDKKYVVLLADLVTAYNTKKVASCWGQALIRSAVKGTIEGTPVRLLDDDMDGTYSQRGRDAILIGRSQAAVPLKQVHQIGKYFYRLEVTGDGSSIGYTRLADTPVGLVRAPISSSALKSLILTGKDASFDIVAAGKNGIPAGSYRLAYGLVSSGSTTLAFRPGQTTPQYDIEAGMINTLRIGKPVRLDFYASMSRGKVGLSAGSVKIVGSGSEIYGPLNFNKGGNVRPPSVIMLNGTKIVSRKNMEYG